MKALLPRDQNPGQRRGMPTPALRIPASSPGRRSLGEGAQLWGAHDWAKGREGGGRLAEGARGAVVFTMGTLVLLQFTG